jgi:hypothetical protein
VLRRVLLVDAMASGACALLALVAADWLSPHLGLSPAFLRGAGLILIPFVALLLAVAARGTDSRPAVGIIIAFNVLWVLASVGVLVTGGVAPTGLGIAFVLVQAAVVALLGWLQFAGLRRLSGDAVAG